MSKIQNLGDVLKTLENLHRDYIRQVYRFAEEVKKEIIDPFLQKRGWRLEVKYTAYALITDKGERVFCGSLQYSPHASDEEVSYICSILESREQGAGIALGAFMKRGKGFSI